MILNQLSYQTPEPQRKIQLPFFSDMPLVFDKREAKKLYHALFNIAADKFEEAPLLKAAFYLHHVGCLNEDRKYFDIARECINWIEKKYSRNRIVNIRTVAWRTERGTIVPYKLVTIAHPLITAGFKVNPLDPNELDDLYNKYETIVPFGYGSVFKLFGYEFPQVTSQTKAARLLKKILHENKDKEMKKAMW